MLDQYLPWVPYELIGQAVVALILLCLGIIGVLALAFGLLFVWVRGWARISNRMYKGYDTTSSDERPPVWKMRISGVTIALSRFKFRKIPAVYREAETLTDDDTTFIQYLDNTLIDQ